MVTDNGFIQWNGSAASSRMQYFCSLPYKRSAGETILLCGNEKIGSDTDLVVATAVTGGPFIVVATMVLRRFPNLGLKSRIAAAPGQFSGNPCSDCQIDPLKSGIAAATRPFPGIPCSDSQIHPLKSRITVATEPKRGQSLHRFASLGLKSGIAAGSSPSSARALNRFHSTYSSTYSTHPSAPAQ